MLCSLCVLLDTSVRSARATCIVPLFVGVVVDEEYYITTFYAGDEQGLLETLSIDAVNHNLLLVPKPYTPDDASFWVNMMLTSKEDLLAPSTVQARNERFFSQEKSIPMQVIRHGIPEGKLVGCVALTPRVGKDVLDLGYYLNPAHHGKGVMATAGVAALRWARDEFGIRRVYSSADCMNPASGRTIEKVSAETAVGEIEQGTKTLRWAAEKVIKGREIESLSRTWEWSI